MGNEQSKKNTNVEIQLNHSRINLILVVNEPNRRYMQAPFAVEKESYNNWKQHFEKAQINSTYLLLPFSHTFQSKQFCGTAGSAKLNYENYPYLLLEQIQNRKAKKKRFDQTELWLLLYCLLDAQKQMHLKNNSCIGDVRPQNIFFNEDGLMKVANLLSWPKETTNYQKFLENQPTYLAPQDLPLAELSQVDNQENLQSEIFSIGLTVLSAANLQDYKGLYNTSSRKFNFIEFENILNQWRLNQCYSDIFKATLSSLLQVNLANRISENVISPWLENYKNEIMARNDFTINDPPQSIINQVLLIRKAYQNSLSSSKGSFNQPLPVLNLPIQSPPTYNSDFKIIGAPIQGSYRLIEQKRLPPVSILPGNSVAQSIYNSAEKPTHLGNFLFQGAPISSTNPIFIDRTVVPTIIENQFSSESGFGRNYNLQGSSNIPRTNFEYSQSAEKRVEQSFVNEQQKVQEKKEDDQQNNQPQISQDRSQKEKQQR